MSILNKLEDLVTSIRVGAKVKTANNGKPVEELVIKYKDLYLEVLLDVETQEPTGDFSWSRNPTMFHTKLRDIKLVEESK